MFLVHVIPVTSWLILVVLHTSSFAWLHLCGGVTLSDLWCVMHGITPHCRHATCNVQSFSFFFPEEFQGLIFYLCLILPTVCCVGSIRLTQSCFSPVQCSQRDRPCLDPVRHDHVLGRVAVVCGGNCTPRSCKSSCACPYEDWWRDRCDKLAHMEV